MTAVDLARANADAWAKIESIDLTYDVTTDLGDGHSRTLADQRWIRSGHHERIVVQTPGRSPEVEDFCFDGSRLRAVRFPGTLDIGTAGISVCNDRQVRCEIRPPLPGGFHGRHMPLLDVFEQASSREPLTLNAIARDWATTVTKQTPSDGSGAQWLLVATRQRADARPGSGADRVELVLDEAHGWLVSEATLTQWMPASDGPVSKPEAAVFKFKVDEFLEFAPQQFIPRRVTYRLRGMSDVRDAPDWRFAFQVTDAHVNQPVAPDLGFRFPENAVVVESVPDDGGQKIHIWGPDNQPQRTFDSDAAFEQYLTATCGQ